MTKEQLLETAKPILFNTEMVRAILDGRKTQTRRAVMPPTSRKNMHSIMTEIKDYDCRTKSKYEIGDILYVRETWRLFDADEECACYDDCQCRSRHGSAIFKADDFFHHDLQKWKLSIHMPKKYARILLRVTNVWEERLQDIDGGGIEKEGLPKNIKHFSEAKNWWIKLWDSTAPNEYKFSDNKSVLVCEFERVEV